MSRSGSRVLAASILLTGLALGAILTGPALASPYIQAHRGGSLHTVGGKQVPRFPENTVPAFRRSARKGFTLELDIKLTKDGVPVVMHDDTLDRTTNCDGLVADLSLAELRHCRVDILGTAGNFVQLDAHDPRTAPIPTMARFLRMAKRRGASISLEIKNIPTDGDFDATNSFAQTVADGIRKSGFPPARLIVQSFWPPNLDVIENDPYFADATTSFLSLGQANDAASDFARSRGYDWVSPQWPVNPGFIQHAHNVGLRVVPYTVDTEPDQEDAAQMGVDALITNDPGLARKALKQVDPPTPKPPPAPSRTECKQVRAHRTIAPIKAFDPAPHAPRVFAMQFRQDLQNVESYGSFRTKIECMIRDDVVPHLARHRPNVVAFNEDVGLMTLGTGTRGAAARDLFESSATAPGCEGQPAPCGAAAAIIAVRSGYSEQVSAYDERFPGMSPLLDVFVAGTDTFARGWMQTFSDLAKRYRVYMLGSNVQAPFRESTDPSEIGVFRDPDLPRPDSVYVATEGKAYNEAFMWGPRNVRKEGPPMLRNVVAQNRKVPLTDLERQIGFSDGPSTGPDAIENVRPYRLPGTRARLAFATSLPAFVYNGDADTGFGQPIPQGVDPCSDTSKYYMRCLDKLGANVVMQDEANDGRWATDAGSGSWQPLEWMGSTWRAVADPTVGFAYNVDPMMVGNLADLPFDGQTAITQRGAATGHGCHYIGNGHFRADPPESDPAAYKRYAGHKRQFLGIAPWVTDGSRDHDRATAAKLAPQSGDPLENDYVETAVIADLPFPVDRGRPACVKPGHTG
jgi:glycerophosphoryl diester phosphodiesterase